MTKAFSELEERVRQSLSSAGLTFKTDVSSGGIQPDFVVQGSDGQLIIVQVKRTTTPQPGLWSRLRHQASLYETALGADRAFFVVDSPESPTDVPAVVTPDQIAAKVKEALAQHKPPKNRLVLTETEATVFAAMPFAAEYDDVFLVAMTDAARAVNAKCYRVDKEDFTGEVIEHIRDSIEKSIAVIVDLSEAKPNVMYEAGYAHALRRPTVHISSTPLSDLPFDVAGWNTLMYSKGQTTQLREPLANRLKAVLR